MFSRAAWLAWLVVVGSVCGQEQPAILKHFEAPGFPPLARQVMLSGSVSVVMLVGPDGLVKTVNTRSAAHPLFQQEAERTVKQWKYNVDDGKDARNRTASATFYFGYSGETRQERPRTTVKADFEGSSTRVFVTTDAVETTHP